jgi:hypothetical protein
MTLPLLIIIIPILSFIGGFCFGKASGIKKGIRIGHHEMVEEFKNVFPKNKIK